MPVSFCFGQMRFENASRQIPFHAPTTLPYSPKTTTTAKLTTVRINNNNYIKNKTATNHVFPLNAPATPRESGDMQLTPYVEYS